jgi:hypothetical protein
VHQRLRFTVIALVLSAFLSLISPPSALARNLFDSLAMTWDNFDDFVTTGLCASAPTEAGLYGCNPAHLPEIKTGRFDAGVFLSATDSVISIVDTLNTAQNSSNNPQGFSTLLNTVFSNYNYSELIFSAKALYVDQYFSLGIHPKKISAQFEVHNPNLPLASISMRDETNINLALGYGFSLGSWKINAGTALTVTTQAETIAETTLLTFASVPLDQIAQTQRMNGIFADFGFTAQSHGLFAVSALLRDIGGYWMGSDRSSQYLFIYPNRVPRFAASFSWIPELWRGQLQIGLQFISLFNTYYAIADEWTATVSYFLGPLRILSSLRPDLIRTGIALRLTDFEASIAQEWVNQAETGRQNQPRFILGVSLGL